MKSKTIIRDESGMALVLVMAILITITAIALTLVNTTSQEMKMAGNYHFDKVAFYNGDSGIYGTPKFVRLLFPEGDAIPESDPTQAGCISYLNTVASGPEEIRARIYGFEGQDATDMYNSTVDDEEKAEAADISMNGCNIPADINIVNMGGGNVTGGGSEFGTGAEGMKGGDEVRFRLVSTGKDAQGQQHTIRAIYRWVPISGGL